MNKSSALIVPAQTPAAANAPAAFHDVVKPLIYIPNGWLWFFWIAGILLAAVLVWLGWRRWRKRSAALNFAPPLPPHVQARRMLDHALSIISQPKPFSIAVSGAIRFYLEDRFQFRAPDRTTEEFLHELHTSNLLSQEQKLSLADFLAGCDLIKFARYEPTETELRALHAAAVRLVDETEPRLATVEGSSLEAGLGPQPAK